eukprot:g20393.t1
MEEPDIHDNGSLTPNPQSLSQPCQLARVRCAQAPATVGGFPSLGSMLPSCPILLLETVSVRGSLDVAGCSLETADPFERNFGAAGPDFKDVCCEEMVNEVSQLNWRPVTSRNSLTFAAQ